MLLASSTTAISPTIAIKSNHSRYSHRVNRQLYPEPIQPSFMQKLTLIWNVFILQGDPELLSVVEDGARRGFQECQLQKLHSGEPWKCPLEMYKKLPLFDNNTFPHSKSAVLTFHSINYEKV